MTGPTAGSCGRRATSGTPPGSPRSGSISQAGHLIRHGYIGHWWRFLPQEIWPQDYRRDAITDNWDDAVGDCRQELVFIGQGIDRDRLFADLDACLLTDAEIGLGPDGWDALPDPLGTGQIDVASAAAGGRLPAGL
ncbi:GTP-binding protein [Pseudonocardia sp. ICBG1142]|uniref:GTP-binding protein n=1 Tax=Pseudonocardia sp. ICBG1142 TaxID=2846760 RepID=UPI0035A831BB